MNKENKYPGSPANHDAQIVADKGSDLHSSLSDTDLEEGEILSESDETVATSPVPATKKAKLAQPAKSKPSARRLLSRTSKEKCAPAKETGEASDSSSQSPKSRFKKVCLAASKSNFATTADVMDTFKLVRTEIRKKYMKLHKTFPKKSFYGVMNNFRESFLEFVDGANFGPLSCQQGELKSKMKKLIVTVFGKLLNNGIVKRIFEQQAGDLKQKLWDFVDVQIDYLLRDIDTTLKGLCKPASPQSDDKASGKKEKVSGQPPVTKPQCQPKEPESVLSKPVRTRQCATVAPYKTGLGSRGKDIRITLTDKDKDSHLADTVDTQTTVGFHPPKDTPSVSENHNKLSGSQNGSLLDKTDFELLTEQQASSLTFNLVRDTQMGEIFKCLLQGSDLLEGNSANGDNTAWSFGTPRKDGDRYISVGTPTKFDSPSKLFSPCKFDTPSKVIAAWSSITPRKMSSPPLKSQAPLNPALFDESCLLEVPSDSRTSASQRSFSILAEDLAVSLTIPSPLKSDNHLSFLQPSSRQPTPDSVISAHISEDALLDEEDATEQDIHLALDTDNSSRGSASSTSSAASGPLATPFVFKPHLPMQALVMERSNDHFIVKIRQASSSADTTLTADDRFDRTLTDEGERHSGGGETKTERPVLSDGSQGTSTNPLLPERETAVLPASSGMCEAPASEFSLAGSGSSTWTKEAACEESSGKPLSVDSQNLSISLKSPEIDKTVSRTRSPEKSSLQISKATVEHNIPSEPSTCQTSKSENATTSPKADLPKSTSSVRHSSESCEASNRIQTPASSSSDSEKQQTERSGSEKGSSGATSAVSGASECESTECSKGGKRKRRQEKTKSKRRRKEGKRSAETEDDKSAETEGSSCRSDGECKSTPTSPSSSGLSAKNVVKKKGEVVVSWTRSVVASAFQKTGCIFFFPPHQNKTPQNEISLFQG